MKKIIFIRYLSGLGASVISSVITIILSSIMGAIITPSSIICYITGIISSAAMLSFSLGWGLKNERELKYWSNNRNIGKPVRWYKIQLCVLPMLIISVPFIIFSIYLFRLKCTNLPMYILDCCITGQALFWLLYYIAVMAHYFSATCPKCGNVYSYCDGEIIQGSYRSYERKEYKTKNRDNSVGVYVDNKKIGELKGPTGSDTYERTIRGSGHETMDYCKFCGRKIKTYHSDSYEVSDWK